MAIRYIVFLCMVNACVGTDQFENCTVIETQDIDVTNCTWNAAKSLKEVNGHCDVVIPFEVCTGSVVTIVTTEVVSSAHCVTSYVHHSFDPDPRRGPMTRTLVRSKKQHARIKQSRLPKIGHVLKISHIPTIAR